MDNKKIVAQKYAKAFVNIYLDQISIDNFTNIKKLEAFFNTHKKFTYFLSIPNIKIVQKEKLLQELFEKFNLETLLSPLVHILAAQKRLFLIDIILKNIRLLYKKRNNIMMFNITSSHQLDKESLEIVKQFLAYKTGKKIMYQYAIDKELVAGIRLQSGTLLWEYSIDKQCEALRKQFNIQEA